MQLCQAEFIGSINNNSVGGWNIDTGFNNSGTYQHIKTFAVEIPHDLFQLALVICPCATTVRASGMVSLSSRATCSMVFTSLCSSTPDHHVIFHAIWLL